MKKTFLKTVALMLILSFAMSFAAIGTAAAGSGTEADPYIITTADDLQAIADDLTAHYKLGADITLTERFAPMGTRSAPFTGSLDGAGFCVTGLSAQLDAESGSAAAGLFAFADGAEIRDLTLGKTLVSATAGGYAYAGAIVGYAITSFPVENK